MFINCHVFQKDSDQDSWDFLRRRGWFIDVGHWEHLPIIAYPILWQLRSYPNFHENTSPVSQVFPFAETEATNFECRQHPTAQLDQLLKTRRQLWIFSEPPCLSCFVNFALFILFGSCFGLRLTRGKVSGCRWLPVHKTELRRTSSRDSTRHRKSKAAKCSKVSNNIKNIQEPAKVSTERHNWRAADGLATHSSYRWREFNGRSRIYETLWNHMTPKRAGMEKQPKRTLALLRHRKIKSEKKKKKHLIHLHWRVQVLVSNYPWSLMIQSSFNMAHFGVPNGQGHEEHWRATPSSGSKRMLNMAQLLQAVTNWIPNTLPILDRATGIFPQIRTPSLKPKREMTQRCSTVQLVNCSTNLEALDAPTFLCKSDLHKYFPPMDMFKGHHKVTIFWTWDCRPYTSCYTSCYTFTSIHFKTYRSSISIIFNTIQYIYPVYIRHIYFIFQEISGASLEGRFPHSAATRKSPWQLPQRPGIRDWRSGEALLNRGDLQLSNVMIW